MSEFDKEAERQKLREKFDRDREKRKETERMSQLLLQGATMTNRHCDTCGDPLFRYQGQEFCATCEGRAQEAEEQAQAQAEQRQHEAQAEQTQAQADAQQSAELDAAGAATGHAHTPAPDSGVTPTGDGRSGFDTDAAGHPTPGAQGEKADGQPDRATTPETAPQKAATDEAERRSSSESVQTNQRTEQQHTGGDDLAVARAALVRTLTHHAQQAEAADGPRRATDHLTAVREAAEALSALDRGR